MRATFKRPFVRLEDRTSARSDPIREGTWSKLGNGSQVALLLFAIFGYFYTVQPIHQKELLDEQIAEKEIQLKRQESKIAGAIAQKESLRRENEAAKRDRQTVEAVLAEAQVSATRAHLDLSSERIRSSQARADLVYERERAELLQGFVRAAESACPFVIEGLRQCLMRVAATDSFKNFRPEDKSLLLGWLGIEARSAIEKFDRATDYPYKVDPRLEETLEAFCKPVPPTAVPEGCPDFIPALYKNLRSAVLEGISRTEARNAIENAVARVFERTAANAESPQFRARPMPPTSITIQ